MLKINQKICLGNLETFVVNRILHQKIKKRLVNRNMFGHITERAASDVIVQNKWWINIWTKILGLMPNAFKNNFFSILR